MTDRADLVVVGAGPGGYAAAFYAADRGRKVTLVDLDKRPGGVCLNRGCIPSKAYLHLARLITDARESERLGVSFGPPQLNLEKMRTWKESVLDKLSQGIRLLAEKRGVALIKGKGYF